MVSPIVIAGPTGSGKSEFAIILAEKQDGEIICADSRQIYAGMQIGTASPTLQDHARIPHHNYNVVNPTESYDAGRFIEDTNRAIQDICKRNKIPILVGGTGLYLRCWRFGLSDVPQRDLTIRAQLNGELELNGLAALYQELKIMDEESARHIDQNDAFRIIRALEIIRITGKKASELRSSHFTSPKQEAKWILIQVAREDLNKRIMSRTKKMFENGIVEEAIALRHALPPHHRLLDTIGYKESLDYADGHIDLDDELPLIDFGEHFPVEFRHDENSNQERGDRDPDDF